MLTFSSILSGLTSLFNIGKLSDTDINTDLLLSQGSITKFIGDMIIEPTFIVTKAASNSQSFNDVMELNLNMFSSLFAAAAMKLIEQDGIDVNGALRILSSSSSTASRLKTISNVLEEDITDPAEIKAIADRMFGSNKLTAVSEAFESRDGKFDKEPSLLIKNFVLTANVTDGENSRTIKIPIMISADIRIISTEELSVYVDVNSKVSSSFARKHRYRSGALSAMEYYFSLDVLGKYSKRLKAGHDSVVMDLEDRKRRALLNNSHTPIGLGRDFGALVISHSEQNLVEQVSKFRLRENNDRNDFLTSIASFNLCVINEPLEVVTVFTSNIKGSSKLPFGKLKKKDDQQGLKTLLDSITNSSKVRL